MPPKPSRAKPDRLDALLTDLITKDGLAFRRARQALATSRDPRTTPRLLQVLREQLTGEGAFLAVRTVLPTLALRFENAELPRDDIPQAVRLLAQFVNHEPSDIACAVMDTLARAQPLLANVARLLGERLKSPSYAIASSALRGLVGLPAAQRSKWVPLLLDRLKRFRNNSEWCWIVECLPPHFARYRERIEPVFRRGLKSSDGFATACVLGCLRQLGPAAAAFIRDVLAYISRQRFFTSEEPHLVHLDPDGLLAVPGLIPLLRHPEETVRYQAATELGAYGARAASAVSPLAELANKRKRSGLHFDADAAQRALEAIQNGPPGAA
jgi:hypothetical protein